MANHRFNVLAATAAFSLAVASEALAGGCCPEFYGNCACGPVVAEVLVAPVVPTEMYLVNQGPVFSGPGHSLPRQIPDAAPAAYPYVGPVYTGYPYGLQNVGLYPRGYYSPYTGYPYVDPSPRGVMYINYRPAWPHRHHRHVR